MTQLYLQLRRVRTNEVITIALEDGIKSIKDYAQKQQFMNMLGQEAFWKKNRLVLWKELSDKNVTVSKDEPNIITTDFINTDYMMGSIRYRLEDYYSKLFKEKEENIVQPQQFSHYDDHNYNHNTGRTKTLRCRRIHMNNLIVRHADLEQFNKEVEALYKKYQVKDAHRLKHGRRYFDHHEAARRLVQRYYL